MKILYSTKFRYLIFACFFCVFILNSMYYWRRTCDDAFISFRYARNFAGGQGLVYNLGERVEGFSNFLWVVLLSVGIKLGLEPVIFSKVLGFFSACAVLALLPVFFTKLEQDGSLPIISFALLASSSPFAYWAVSGMETLFFAFLLLLAVLVFINETSSSPDFPWSAVILLLLGLTRPEGVLYTGIMLLWFIRLRTSSLFIKKWLVVFFFPYMLFVVLRLWYYGTLLPNTYTAKIGFRALWFPKGLFLYFANFINLFDISHSSFTILVFVGIFFFILLPSKRDFFLVSVIAFFCLFCVFTGGDWMENYRFIVPVLPFVLIAIELGFLRAYRLFTKPSAVLCVPFILFTISLTALACANTFLVDESKANHLLRGGKVLYKPLSGGMKNVFYWSIDVSRNFTKGMRPIEWKNTKYILENFREGDVILFSDIGFMGYITNNPIIDMYGLVTPSTAGLLKAHMLGDSQEKKVFSDKLLAEVEKKEPVAILIYSPLNNKARLDKLVVFSELEKSDTFHKTWKLKERFIRVGGKAELLVYLRRGYISPSLGEVIKRYERLKALFPCFTVINKRLMSLTKSQAKYR